MVVWLGTAKDNSTHILSILSLFGCRNDLSEALSNPHTKYVTLVLNFITPDSRGSAGLWLLLWLPSCPLAVISEGNYLLDLKQWDHHPFPEASTVKDRGLKVEQVRNPRIQYLSMALPEQWPPYKRFHSKDSIYGVLSLLQKSDKDLKIKLSYTQKTSSIYPSVALRHIKHYRKLDLFTTRNASERWAGRDTKLSIKLGCS